MNDTTSPLSLYVVAPHQPARLLGWGVLAVAIVGALSAWGVHAFSWAQSQSWIVITLTCGSLTGIAIWVDAVQNRAVRAYEAYLATQERTTVMAWGQSPHLDGETRSVIIRWLRETSA